MSTYYFATCDKHRVISQVIAGRSFPDRWWQNDGPELADFLAEHASCVPMPRIVSEYDGRVRDYTAIKEAA